MEYPRVGTVFGPVLFLLHISDIAREVSSATNTTSYVTSIYDWGSEENMLFNSEKFEFLRYWPRWQKPDFVYRSPDGTVIQEKEHLRDLGVEMSSDLLDGLWNIPAEKQTGNDDTQEKLDPEQTGLHLPVVVSKWPGQHWQHWECC